jgi:hypothetical protein
LMLYLSPAVLAVFVLGGFLVLLEGLAGLVGACTGGPARALLGRGSRVGFLTAGGEGRTCDLPPEFPGAPRRERERDLAPVRGRRGD